MAARWRSGRELQPLEKGLVEVALAPSSVSGELVQSIGTSMLSSNLDRFGEINSRSNGRPESSATAS